jgi:hypothetical protein
VCRLADEAVRPISATRNAVWALANLLRGEPAPSLDRVKGCLPTLLRALRRGDHDASADALWALSYLSGSEQGIDALRAHHDNSREARCD